MNLLVRRILIYRLNIALSQDSLRTSQLNNLKIVYVIKGRGIWFTLFGKILFNTISKEITEIRKKFQVIALTGSKETLQ